MKYAPNRKLDTKAWLDLDEGERIGLVEDYHRRIRANLPNAKIHAVVHTIVENQVALGDGYPVAAKLQQLMDERLDRHEAVHAIGSVMAERLFKVMQGGGNDLNEPYLKDLAALTAKKWLASTQ